MGQTRLIVGSVTGAFFVPYIYWDLVRNRKIFGSEHLFQSCDHGYAGTKDSIELKPRCMFSAGCMVSPIDSNLVKTGTVPRILSKEWREATARKIDNGWPTVASSKPVVLNLLTRNNFRIVSPIQGRNVPWEEGTFDR